MFPSAWASRDASAHPLEEWRISGQSPCNCNSLLFPRAEFVGSLLACLPNRIVRVDLLPFPFGQAAPRHEVQSQVQHCQSRKESEKVEKLGKQN